MRRLITALIRVFIIYVFLNVLTLAISNIAYIWNFRDSGSSISIYGSQVSIGWLLIGFFIILLILWIVWWKAGSIAILLSGRMRERELVIQTTNTALMQVVMRIVGICLIVTTLPGLFGMLAYYVNHNDLVSGSHIPLEASEISRLVIEGTTIVIGIVLIIGLPWFKKAFIAIRDFVNKPEEENPPS